MRRLLYVSSVGVFGTRNRLNEAGQPIPFTEESPCTPVGEYAWSKMAAEDELRRIAERAGLDVVIVRPPVVYGPGAPANIARLVNVLSRISVVPVPATSNARSLVYVGNLTDAIARCLEHPRAEGELFLVADAEAISTSRLVRRLVVLLGRRAVLIPVPLTVLRLGAAVLRRSADLGRLTASFMVSTWKIQDRLGWTPPYSLEDGLAETARRHRAPRAA